MTIRADVTNTGDRVIGRAGYRFEVKETKSGCEFTASQFPEVYMCPDLLAVVVSADSPQELPEDPQAWGVEVKLHANKAARELAEERGVNLFGVEGTGKDGQILKADVERAAAGLPGSGRDFVPSEGSFEATTLDAPEKQEAAAESVIGSVGGQRSYVEERVVAVPGDSEEPDQTNQAKDEIGTQGE